MGENPHEWGICPTFYRGKRRLEREIMTDIKEINEGSSANNLVEKFDNLLQNSLIFKPTLIVNPEKSTSADLTFLT